MWFNEVLEDHDKNMGFEYDDWWKADDTKFYSFKVKSGVKDASLSAGQDIVKDGKGSYNCKHKTELKAKMTDELQAKLVSSNKEHEVEFEYKPSDLNKDGKKVEVELEAKCQPATKTYSGELSLKAGGFDLGPVVPWTSLKLATNGNMDHTVDFSQSLVYEKDYHAAFKVCLAKDMTMSAAYAYLAMVGSSGNYYLRSAIKDQLLGVGMWNKYNDVNYSGELQYDITGKKAGIFGQPLFFRLGQKMKFGSSTSYNPQILWGDRFTVKEKIDFKVNDKMNVGLTCLWDVMDTLTAAEKAQLKFGMSMELKI